jgi:hypothetical protein
MIALKSNAKINSLSDFNKKKLPDTIFDMIMELHANSQEWVLKQMGPKSKAKINPVLSPLCNNSDISFLSSVWAMFI